MDWLGSWQLTLVFLWLLGALSVVAIVAINPADDEDELLKDWLRDGFDPDSNDVKLNPHTIA